MEKMTETMKTRKKSLFGRWGRKERVTRREKAAEREEIERVKERECWKRKKIDG